MLLASLGAQTVQEVIARLAATVIPPHHFERGSATQRCFYGKNESGKSSSGGEGCGRLATICPLWERQEAEQAAAITARFVSLLLLALSTDAAPKFR